MSFLQRRISTPIALSAILLVGGAGSTETVKAVDRHYDQVAFDAERDVAAQESRILYGDMRLTEFRMQSIAREVTEDDELELFCATPDYETWSVIGHTTEGPRDIGAFIVIHGEFLCPLIDLATVEDYEPRSGSQVNAISFGIWVLAHEIGHALGENTEAGAECVAYEIYREVASDMNMPEYIVNAVDNQPPDPSCLE